MQKKHIYYGRKKVKNEGPEVFLTQGKDGKRNPDVYCKFQDKELVFEIQLSDLSLAYILLLMAGTWISCLLKNNMFDDIFNTKNESFMQETKLMINNYSVNLPTKFWYKKKS
jgi:hypothetical protein